MSDVGDIEGLDLLPSSLHLVEIQDEIPDMDNKAYVSSHVDVLGNAISQIISEYEFVLNYYPPLSAGDTATGAGRMQTLGCLLAIISVAWCMKRADALKELQIAGDAPWLYYWLRFVIPAAVLLFGIWWLLTDVFKIVF